MNYVYFSESTAGGAGTAAAYPAENFMGFESAMMQCPDTLPHFKMCERKIPFQKEINASNYVDYFYGVSRITDTGYKEQAANITKMLSELSVVS